MLKKSYDAIIEKNPFVHLGDAVYEMLYQKIISLELEPGHTLSETALAKELGSSRTPIRNALLALEADGLLSRGRGQSFQVSTLKKEECQQLMEIRIAIETQAVYWAVDRISEKQLEQLASQLEHFMKAFEAWDRVNMVKYDHMFHQTIIDAANNMFISNMYRQITPRIVHYRNFLFEKTPKELLEPIMYSSIRLHKAIYHAVKLGLAVDAKERMEKDIAGMSNMIAFCNSYL